MLENHPLLIEKESYKVKYLNVLEYFSQKYSANDPWANQTLQLYIKKFLGTKNSHKYDNFDLQRNTKPVLATKFRPFKFFSYRYCLIIDTPYQSHITQKQIGVGVTAVGAVSAVAGICTSHAVLTIGGVIVAAAGIALIVSDKGDA